MRFAIRVEETLGRTVIVEADALDEAVGLVQTAVENDKLFLDGIDDFCEREIKPSDAFENGEIPEGTDVSYYEKL